MRAHPTRGGRVTCRCRKGIGRLARPTGCYVAEEASGVKPAGLKARFLDFPIRRKLMLIVLVTSVIVTGMTTVIFYVADLLSFHSHEVEHRRSLAEMICRDTRHAVALNSRSHAAETLRSLAGDDHIQSAWIVLKSGEVFASYVRYPGKGGLRTVEAGGRVMLAPDALADDRGGPAGIFSSIKTVFACDDKETAGCTTIIVSDMRELTSRMEDYLAMVLLVLWGVAVLGYLVTYRLQRIITDPLTSVVNAMERIRATKDYSLRVESGRSDEIGILSDCFNRMLEELESHDRQLGGYQERLADLIAIRTEELLRVKKEAESQVSRGADVAGPDRSGGVARPDGGTGGGSGPVKGDDLRLYALIDCIDGEVWFLDARSGVVTANRAAAETLATDFAHGLDREALAEGYEIYHFDFQELKEDNVLSAWNIAGTSVRRMEVALLTDGDEQRFQLINAEPYRNGAGELAGTIFIATDITAQKEVLASLREVSGSLIEGEEALRKSLAAELHDEIGRDLAAMHLFNETIKNGLPAETRQRLGDKLESVDNLLDDMSCKVASIISELRPPLLDDFGLVTALKNLADTVSRRHRIEVDLVVADGFPRLGSLELTLYRIAQEATNNAVKHSGATSILISLEEDEETVRLLVSDNGCGFDPARHHGSAKRPSWGLTMMRERTESCGGDFFLESAPGAGTKITVVARMNAWR